MASAETTNSRATAIAASFHWVRSFEGIFPGFVATWTSLAGTADLVPVEVEVCAVLIPVAKAGETVGNDEIGHAAAATGAGATARAEAARATGATTAGIFCDVVTEAGTGVTLGATAETAPVAVLAATAFDRDAGDVGDTWIASSNAAASSLPL